MSKETVKEIKISDKLLSWVLGCECSVCSNHKIKNDIIYVFPKGGLSTKLNKYRYNESIARYEINIHELTHLAKIKCFKYKYSIDSFHDSVEVVTLEGILEKIKLHEKEPYSIIEIIDCLEWVRDKVGGG